MPIVEPGCTPPNRSRSGGGLTLASRRTSRGSIASTRRGYVQAFKGFHAFLVARKASEIEAAFGVRLVNPVDEFNAARHVGSDSPSVNPPPDPERME